MGQPLSSVSSASRLRTRPDAQARSVWDMFAALLAFFLVLPFLEIWVAIKVAGLIGAPLTMMLVIGMSVLGWFLLRGEGVGVWRRINAEVAAGRTPAQQMLDGVLVLIGGVCLILPGFITGVFGLLLLLPPVRSVLRPVLSRWMARRAERLVRSGRMSAMMVDTVVDAEGRVRTRTHTTAEVIDTDGWDAGEEPHELPVDHRSGSVIDGHVVGDGPDGRPTR